MASQVTIASATDHSIIGHGTVPIHGGQMYLRARQVAMALGATPALLARARAAFHKTIWAYVDLCSGSGGVCRQLHFFAQTMNDELPASIDDAHLGRLSGIPDPTEVYRRGVLCERHVSTNVPTTGTSPSWCSTVIQ